MCLERPRKRTSIGNFAPMPGQIPGLGQGDDFVERGQIIAQIPVGRGHHRGVPPHHMIAHQHEILALKGQGDMVGAMAGRGDDAQLHPVNDQHISIVQHPVGLEPEIT